MTTALLTTGARPRLRLTYAGVLHSEWIKFVSLRSTIWSLALLPLFSVGLGFVLAADYAARQSELAAVPASSVAIQIATAGVLVGQLVVAVLGVLVISGEYSTGMIRSTLTAIPNRLPVLLAKAIILGVSVFTVGLASTVGTFLATSALGPDVSITEPDVVQALVGGPLYLVIVALFALGLGTIIRSAAGGIAGALGVVLVLPIVFTLIPAKWAADIGQYLLPNAGSELFTPMEGGLEYPQAILVALCWVAASLVGAAILLKRRDA